MKICFLEGDMSRNGGTERMTSILANHLVQEHDVTVLSLRFCAGKVFYKLNQNVNHIPLKSVQGKTGIIRQIKEIRSIISYEKIDVIINVDTGMGLYGVCAAIGIVDRTRVITWEHANYFNNWNSRFFPYLRKVAVKNSDYMVVLTEKDKLNYEKYMPSKTPIEVIPNPIEKHEFKYDIKSKMILSAGQLVKIKGYDRVIEMGKQIFSKYPDWKWVICGEGEERKRLEKLIEDASLQHNIHLPGTVENMEDYYRNSALFVLTSEMEGLPMVLLEAKSYGLPIVSFDIMTGPSDIVMDGINGFLVNPYNLEVMTEKITKLIDNPHLRMKFSKHTQDDIEKFDIEQILMRWKKLLKGLER